MERYRFPEQKQALLESLQMPMAIYQFVDKRVVTLVLSDGFCELFGYDDRAQAYYDMDHDMYKDAHPDDVARIANAAFRFATEGGTYEVIYRTRKKDSQSYRVVHAMGRHVVNEEGVRLAHIWYTDEGSYTEEPDGYETELNRSLNHALHEESLLKASHYDYLTGLPSMAYFFELAEGSRMALLREEQEAALLFLDLNGMKFFNQKHSFAEGDRLLRGFGKLLSGSFGTENCCRIGADHFAAVTAEEGLEQRLEKLFEASRGLNGGNSLPVRVGIYLDRGEMAHISTACDRAKLACDAIRSTFRSSFNYYKQSMRDDLQRRQYVLSNLDRALAEDWIKVWFQPIVRAVNGRVCDEEALARWIDPELGLISPADFVPALEDAKLAYKLDLHVLEKALQKMRVQREANLHVVPQSINLSRSDFDVCDIVEEIRRRVDEAGEERSMITIEITESVVGKDFEFMKEQIQRFQALGFPVWMDDFGSGYSSLDVLQSIRFNLIKFDMRFMQRLDEGDSGKIILTELMKMATALGVDTVCEGVEKAEQVSFLREIGCSKLQGYYFQRPIPIEKILERYEKGIQIGFEDPEESAYFENVGRINLYDLAVISNEDENAFQHFFNTVPMAVMEVLDEKARYLRSNQSYRDFLKRFFGMELQEWDEDLSAKPFIHGEAFMGLVRRCCESGNRAFFDEKMPDGSTVHSFVRRIAVNPVNGKIAVAIAVLSITDPDQGPSYASIARALAANYHTLYYVDLESERFIQFSSPIGGEDLAMERHGEHFFAASREDAEQLYQEDREGFFAAFTKENILHELDRQGVFTLTYRIVDNGVPIYVNMKIMRMQNDPRHIIIGISIIDHQMKQQKENELMHREQDAYARIMALSGDYLSLYTIEKETGRYLEFTSTDEYRSFGFARQGEDFFRQAAIDGRRVVSPEDLERYLRELTRDKVLLALRENGSFQLQYHILFNGRPRPVSLKIALVREHDGEKLIAGLRGWKERK